VNSGQRQASDAVVIGTARPALRGLLPRLKAEGHVVDLAGHHTGLRQLACYDGACW
jgi:hypothetical protein